VAIRDYFLARLHHSKTGNVQGLCKRSDAHPVEPSF
jgi:hypothetical protein